jgi:CRP-like cAMP-binding protein
MSIEINQLVIRAVVAPRAEQASATTAVEAERIRAQQRASVASPMSNQERASIVALCVREVLRKMADRRQR